MDNKPDRSPADVAALVGHYIVLRMTQDQIEADLARAKAATKEVADRLLPAMEAQGIQTLGTDDYTVYLHHETYARLIDEPPDEWQNLLKAHQLGDWIVTRIDGTKAAAWVKDQGNLDVPDAARDEIMALLQVSHTTQVRARKRSRS